MNLLGKELYVMSKKKKKPITFQQFNKMINQFLTELKRKKK